MVGNAAVITFGHLQAGYQGRAVTPVLSTKLAQGSMTALTGANGSGKSTLIKTIAGLLPPVSGCCDLQVSRREVGWLPQRSELETRFPLTVFELVSIGWW
ncbi:ATP-binding cassette domain-containing protein, partial [Cronobacter sakazakii]|uniref:ATP-binding cassette domain-containing protein n=1 Tax=Cronobacter sakazakii TaxID=28141 RepID=UPI003F64FCFE